MIGNLRNANRTLRFFPHFCFWLTTILVGGLPSASHSELVAIATHGPAAKRLNIVVLSEGYTSNQLGQFLVDATNTLNALFASSPFQEYQSYFNTYAITVASAEAGSDHPTSALYRDTYFNSSYDPDSDLLISIPPHDADTNFNNGQGKVNALLQSNVPNCQLSILLVNDSVAGGSDGSGNTAILANAPGASVFVIHETGHVLANLGDEYTAAYPEFPDVEEPNTTVQTNTSLIKWAAWINTNATPIPTPPTTPYASSVGLFQGPHYHASGWYRPQINCAMRNFSSPFCAVCREALVISIYRLVQPVEIFSPASTNLFVTGTEPLTFTLNVMQPATHALKVQWFTNSVAVGGETNLFFYGPAGFFVSNTLVSAHVQDDTPFVRNDPLGVLTQTISWNVHVVNLSLQTPVLLADGSLLFQMTGNAPQGFVLETSTNLFDWQPLVTNALVAGEFVYTNAAAASEGNKFFRARVLPW